MRRRPRHAGKAPLIELLTAWARLRARDGAQWDQAVPDGNISEAVRSRVDRDARFKQRAAMVLKSAVMRTAVAQGAAGGWGNTDVAVNSSMVGAAVATVSALRQ